MSELHLFDVIVIGGGHAGRAGVVREHGSRPASAQATDGPRRVSLSGQDGREDETSVPALTP